MTATALPAGFKYKAAFFAGRPRHSDDHFSFLHPKMDRRRRAKIFAPFDALDGYSESIDSKNIEYFVDFFLLYDHLAVNAVKMF